SIRAMKRLLSLLGVHGRLEGGLFSKVWPFPAVIGSTVLIAWATEVAAFFISRGMALAILAFLQVSPEFAVEAVLARNAARDVRQLPFVTANFTGSNRLLVGAGLPLVFLVGRYVLTRKGRWPGYLPMAGHHALEVMVLMTSSLYSLLWVIRGGLGLIDTILLGAMFAFYLWVLWKMPAAEESEVELLRGIPRRVMLERSRTFQRNFAIGEFLLTAAQAIFAAAAMCKFRFLRWEAFVLLGLWFFQLFDPLIDPALQHLPSLFGGTDPQGHRIIVREYITVAFFALTAWDIWLYRKELRVIRNFRQLWRGYIAPPADA